MQALFNGQVIADSDSTVVVEGNHYFPPDSIKQDYFESSDNHTMCFWKGTASYYNLKVGDKKAANVAWYYPEPTAAAKQIKDYVAFYPHLVTLK